MFRTLVADLEAALAGAMVSDLSWLAGVSPLPDHDAAAFSQWLPYRAWLDDRPGLVIAIRWASAWSCDPQSGADEEMTSILTALYAAARRRGPALQFHLFASPDIRAPLARYAATAAAG